MRCALIATICFLIGGLLATCLTYQFGRCKNSEIIFRLQNPKGLQNTSDTLMSENKLSIKSAIA